ncbi:MAG: stage 0 sporulation protein J [Planctomycetota bacterium]|nr:MAG: stage 0 sporulation protein J [Planctomycetota bacterium]
MERRLGRGLDSLIANTVRPDDTSTQEVLLAEIRFNPNQPRKVFDEKALAGLAQSIRQHGVLQPVVVRKKGAAYDLIAGERRCRASLQAGLKAVPAVIVDAEGVAVLEMALIENIQREDLGPLEEALAFSDLLVASEMTHQQLADRLGKSRSVISNSLRLLELPPSLKQYLADGLLNAGQARTLLGVSDPAERERLGDEAVTDQLSVRELERRVRGAGAPSSARSGSTSPRGSGTATARSGKAATPKPLGNKSHYEEKMRNLYGTKVMVAEQDGRGEVKLSFYSARDRDRLITMLLSADQAAGAFHED